MYNNCWLCNAYLEEDEEFCLDCELSFEYENEYYDVNYDSNIGLIDKELLESKGITLNLVPIDSEIDYYVKYLRERSLRKEETT